MPYVHQSRKAARTANEIQYHLLHFVSAPRDINIIPSKRIFIAVEIWRAWVFIP